MTASPRRCAITRSSAPSATCCACTSRDARKKILGQMNLGAGQDPYSNFLVCRALPLQSSSFSYPFTNLHSGNPWGRPDPGTSVGRLEVARLTPCRGLSKSNLRELFSGLSSLRLIRSTFSIPHVPCQPPPSQERANVAARADEKAAQVAEVRREIQRVTKMLQRKGELERMGRLGSGETCL